MNANEVFIKTGHSCTKDAKTAVAEFASQVWQDEMALVMFFCSPKYDLEELASEMNRRFPGVSVIGCTTAGEIGPAGYVDCSLSGMSFPADKCLAAVDSLPDLEHFEVVQGHNLAQSLVRDLEAKGAKVGMESAFAVLLIDGLSMREEPVAHALQSGLGIVQMIGGSAGDDLRFEQTLVFHDGVFSANSAVLALVSTSLPFRAIRTQHFISAEERVVVTEADASRRLIKEINGYPAVQEYARLVGAKPEELLPSHFATWPVVVMIDGTDYVRSIQKANPDGSLSFFCAIDEGLVLRVARGEDILGRLKNTFDQIRAEIGEPQAVLVCDCILRNLEATRNGQKEAIGDVFRENRAVGFSTYGEQFVGVHVNQTLTGIAFGRS